MLHLPKRCVRRLLCLLLALCLCMTLPSALSVRTAAAELDSLGVSAQSAILIDADSGKILYQKNAQTRLPMASTTKIMTALCAVELAEPSRVISVSPKAVGVEGSSVYLYAEEELTLEQLLYALLLESANDAATASAIALSGSVEAFADCMNDKARELGLQDTHFENPHGLDHEQHYTTAHDLALITRAALQHPILRAIVATRKTNIPLNGTQGVRTLLNHNKLLRMYDGTIGVKTGFTKRSGRCLVSAAEREGLTLIAVTLNAPDDWNDHMRMLDAGFAAYDRVTLCESQAYRAIVPVAGGKEQYVVVQNRQSCAVTLPSDRSALSCTVELPHMLFAPVTGGTLIGRLVFRCDTNADGAYEVVGELPLYTAYTVEPLPRKTLWQRICDWFASLIP